jgi:AraC-like DNA-binding protein
MGPESSVTRWLVLQTDKADSRHGDLSPSPGSEPVVARASLVTEADDYTRSVRGIDIEAIRAGPGTTSTEIRSVVSQDYVASSLRIGFPVFSRTTLPDNTIGVATISSTPPGARWCGIDLSAGDVLIYGRGAEHLAVNPVGMRFAFATTTGETLERVADDLGLGITVPTGVCKVMTPSAGTCRLSRTLRGITGDSAASNGQPAIGNAGLLDNVCRILATETFESTSDPTRIDNRAIVLACIEYAESVERRPTIEELCKTSFVSERRLRYAFTETHGMAPCQFFLGWALDLSRRRFLRADPTIDTVSRIAAECGLPHLGRFARRYKQQFGESPSTTLMR